MKITHGWANSPPTQTQVSTSWIILSVPEKWEAEHHCHNDEGKVYDAIVLFFIRAQRSKLIVVLSL